jgi:hypothetical protein
VKSAAVLGLVSVDAPEAEEGWELAAAWLALAIAAAQ